jgi:hypothetical protein
MITARPYLLDSETLILRFVVMLGRRRYGRLQRHSETLILRYPLGSETLILRFVVMLGRRRYGRLQRQADRCFIANEGRR